MFTSHRLASISFLLIALTTATTNAAELCTNEPSPGVTELSVCGQPPFRTTTAAVMDETLIEAAPPNVLVVTWNESDGVGITPFYA